MTKQNSFASRAVAAASAFMISLLLISGTVTTPSTAQAHTVYVSEVA